MRASRGPTSRNAWMVVLVTLALAVASAAPAVGAGEQGFDCDDLGTLVGAEPEGFAEECGLSTVPVDAAVPATRAPTDLAFAHDIGFISDNCVNHALNDFPGQSVVGTSAAAIFGYDYSVDLGTLYGIDNGAQQLVTVDPTCGVTTVGAAVPSAGHTWTGLTVDPITGTMYASSVDGVEMQLYTIDPSTGTPTAVGGPSALGLAIDIAMNCDGEMYAHDIATDSIYSIDPATGTPSLIGPTGFGANFAQGMDFDNDTGELYIYLYQGGGANVYGTVDLTTGAVTPLATNDPLGEFEGATMTSCVVEYCDGELATIQGALGDDTLRGTNGPDVIHGRSGNDTIYGLRGNDKICGGPGDDVIFAGPGLDFVHGGTGDDYIEGNGQDDVLKGFGGADTLSGSGGDDHLYGGSGPDAMYGGGGDDYLSGAGGADTLVGNAGTDTLYGGPGVDACDGEFMFGC